jgi:hypothetical protein
VLILDKYYRGSDTSRSLSELWDSRKYDENEKDPWYSEVHSHQDKTKRAFSKTIVVPKQHCKEDALLTTISQLSQILQELLIADANRIGRKSGFIQRQRRSSGASFAQSLIFGWQSNPQASLEELCQSAFVCGVAISPQGLQKHLNSPQANRFLHQLLLQGVGYLVQSQSERDDLLASFAGVYIQDSSQIELPSCLHTIWQDTHVMHLADWLNQQNSTVLTNLSN